MSCFVSVSACFPQPRITDVRKEGYDPRTAWALFDTDHVNATLATELSELERSVNNADRTDKRSLTVEELVEVSTPHTLDFGVSELSSPPEVVYVQVENTGPLAAVWSLDFPRNESKEQEHWTDAADMSFHQLKQDAIMEHRLFVVEPSSGRIEPGEKQVVQFTYGHRFSGEYTLPAVLDFEGGKKVPLLLKATTLGQLPPFFTLPKSADSHQLEPVALGISEENAMVQYFPLVNNSKFDIEYQVDQKAFDRVRNENYGFPVMQCRNPSGIVPAGTEGKLEIVFCPIEDTEYVVPVKITTKQSGKTGLGPFQAMLPEETSVQHIVLKGGVVPLVDMTKTITDSGFSSSSLEYQDVDGVRVAKVSKPSSQTLFLPGQLSSLSSESVSFGSVATHSANSRIVTLNNRSSSAVTYVWTEYNGTASVRVTPRTGSLQAGESKVLKVDIVAGARSSVVDQHLVCQVRKIVAPDSNSRPSSSRASVRPGMKLKGNKDVETAALQRNLDTYGSDHIVGKSIGASNRISVVDRTLAGHSNVRSHSHDMFWPEKRILKHPFSDSLTSPESYDVERYVGSLQDRTFEQLYLFVSAKILDAGELDLVASKEGFPAAGYVVPPSTSNQQGRDTPEGMPQTDAVDRIVAQSFLEELVQDSLSHTAAEAALLSDGALPQPVPLFGELSKTDCAAEVADRKSLSAASVPAEATENNGELDRLTESVLEKTFFNMMCESNAGDFDITAAPRKILVSGVQVHD